MPLPNSDMTGPADAPPGGSDMPPLPKATALLHSAVAGRTDHLQTKVPPGAYVVPADIVSGIGEGNTLAGARILHQIFGDEAPPPTGPSVGATSGLPAEGRATGGGIKINPKHEGLLHKNLGVPAGNKIPADKLAAAKNSPSAAIRKRATFAENAKGWNKRADGGAADDAEEHVPILGAGGECIIYPDAIVRKFGSLKKGHKLLDDWVVFERKKIAKTMQKLPGPVKE